MTGIVEPELESRYIVGIDLGTTNSAVCFVDTEADDWSIRCFAVPQLVDAGQVEALETLPSFHYQPTAAESSGETLRLPWGDGDRNWVVGVFARERGTRTPGRLIASAKSWLCHSGVDRTAALLPWQGAEDVDRLSPIQASSRYLQHIREAWDARHQAHPLADQDIVLTLPASFDEVARELTVEAAHRAGLPRVVLIEEPQAAFYAWIDAHHDDWESQVAPGQKILVCDIGGGTSDFTLIRVRRGEGENVQFHRVAVGEHLILGGDNLDLALAKHVEQGMGGPLPPNGWDALVRQCRRVKEEILGDSEQATISFNLPGSGSKLIGGGQRVEVNAQQARDFLLDGFFPTVDLDDKPRREQSGFREFGLPYAPDAAVTRYLAAFLTTHRYAGDDIDDAARPSPADTVDPARPDIVLFNGGLFASALVQQRVIGALSGWFGDGSWSPRILANRRLDLAVARGAAYYGTVRRGRGVKIAAGLARSYYIGVAGEQRQAVCLVPGNAEAGQEIALSQRQFDLLVHQPVEFPLYISSTRLVDAPGEVVDVDPDQMKILPPIRTVLRTRGKKQAASIRVELHARLTEIGTMELWCHEVGSDRRWRLQFDVRSAVQTDVSASETAGELEGFLEASTVQRCSEILADTFGAEGQGKPEAVVKRLAAELECQRHQWPMTLLRQIWETLIELESGRRKSAVHEARWLNLLGYALRPGYGLAVDDWRVAETWRLIQGKLAFGTPATRTESWILWRRIAGGLSAGQQRALAEPLLSAVRNLGNRHGSKGGDFGVSPQQSAEMWRLLGSLELLEARTKVELGTTLVDLVDKKSMKPVQPAIVWAVGRIGSRVPVYGPLNTVVSTELAGKWLRRLLDSRASGDALTLAVMQLARRTEDRYRDIPAELRAETVEWLKTESAPEHLIQLVERGGTLEIEEQNKVFGESLPIGLRIL